MNFGSAASFTAIMLLAGMVIPIMATMSGGLARQMESGPAAVSAIFSVALVCAALATLVTGLPDKTRIASIEPLYLFGGTMIAFYALSITLIGPRFGMGNAIFCVLAGQIISAAIIDHYGLLGAPVMRIDPMRIAGILLMVVGLALARK